VVELGPAGTGRRGGHHQPGSQQPDQARPGHGRVDCPAAHPCCCSCWPSAGLSPRSSP
jgi:hypothetical protein